MVFLQTGYDILFDPFKAHPRQNHTTFTEMDQHPLVNQCIQRLLRLFLLQPAVLYQI